MATETYEIACTACAFTAVVEGAIDDVFDQIDDHQAATADSPRSHPCEFERVAAR